MSGAHGGHETESVVVENLNHVGDSIMWFLMTALTGGLNQMLGINNDSHSH